MARRRDTQLRHLSYSIKPLARVTDISRSRLYDEILDGRGPPARSIPLPTCAALKQGASGRRDGTVFTKQRGVKMIIKKCPNLGTRLSYSIRRLAMVCDVSRSLIYQEIAAGHLIAHKLGRRTIVRRSDANRWLRSRPLFVQPLSGVPTNSGDIANIGSLSRKQSFSLNEKL
jgi:hypothetical protein